MEKTPCKSIAVSTWRLTVPSALLAHLLTPHASFPSPPRCPLLHHLLILVLLLLLPLSYYAWLKEDPANKS